jgi:transposase
VDEVSWKRGHHYLTVITCHDTGRVVWVGAGDRAQALERFFDALGPSGRARLLAVSSDLGRPFLGVIARRAPQAAICADPFHLVQMAHFALDRVRARNWQRLRTGDPEGARWLKGARFALRRGPTRRTTDDEALLAELERENQDVYRAWLWVEQLRSVLRERRPAAEPWLVLRQLADAALALGHPRFAALGRTLRRHAEKIVKHDPAGALQRPHRGNELDGAPAQPPRPRLPGRRQPHRAHPPRMRRPRSRATHLNARRAPFGVRRPPAAAI